MVKKLVLLIGLSLFCFKNYGKNKIIILVSPPRSLSTAFLRMMESRGDFYIMHEPLIKPYDFIHYPELTKDWFRTEALSTYQEVKNTIIEKSKTRNVFIKEMGFSAREFLLHDDLIKKDNIYVVFLLRNPHHVVISFYNALNKVSTAQIPHFENLIGYKATWELFENVATIAKNKPIIIRTENLYMNPKETIKRYCDHIGIDFIVESLVWKNLGNSFNGKEWLESKYGNHLQHCIKMQFIVLLLLNHEHMK